MKILRVSFSADETTIVTTDEFESLDLLSQMDILKDVIYDLRVIYSDKKKEHTIKFLIPSKQKAIKQRAKDRAMQAFEMRQQGKKFREIGEAMGISPTRAQQLVNKAQRIVDREARWNKT
jgi:hypothetical protein